MATIVNTRKNGNNVTIEASMKYEEYLELGGNLLDILIISSHNGAQTSIAQRGTNCATKYFIIPRQFRNNLNVNAKVECKHLQTPDKSILVYFVQK